MEFLNLLAFTLCIGLKTVNYLQTWQSRPVLYLCFHTIATPGTTLPPNGRAQRMYKLENFTPTQNLVMTSVPFQFPINWMGLLRGRGSYMNVLDQRICV